MDTTERNRTATQTILASYSPLHAGSTHCKRTVRRRAAFAAALAALILAAGCRKPTDPPAGNPPEEFSAETQITAFNVTVPVEVAGVVDSAGSKVIRASLPADTPLTAVKGVFTLSAGATISPDIQNEPADFSAGYKNFTVTAQDSTTTAIWKVELYLNVDLDKEYDISVDDAAAERISADMTAAKVGTTITLTVSPPEPGGDVLDTLTVTPAGGANLTISDGTEADTYTFTMPANNVTVLATFAPPSNDATLTGITPSAGLFTQKDSTDADFDAAVFEYELLLDWTVDDLSFTYDKGHIGANVVIQAGELEISAGTPLDPPPAVGETTATFTVTAQDSTTTQDYVVKVYKQASPELASIVFKTEDLPDETETSPAETLTKTLQACNDVPAPAFSLILTPQTQTSRWMTVTGDFSATQSTAAALTFTLNGASLIENVLLPGDTKNVDITVCVNEGQKWEATKTYALTFNRPLDPDAPSGGPMAAGGVLRFVPNGDNTYDEVHIFTTVGSTESLVFENGVALPTAQVLVVGGGGGGGGAMTHANGSGGVFAGAGGGVGGAVTFDLSHVITDSTTVVTVGAGGTGGYVDRNQTPNNPATAGGNSAFGSNNVTAAGGGFGTNMWIQSSSTPGDWRKDAGSGAGGAATNQGSYSGYGGTKYYLRNGGPGLDTTILGAKTYGAGGSVSGGHGAGTVLANSGAGGWGAGSYGSAVVGGAGGSGIVIVRFPYTAP